MNEKDLLYLGSVLIYCTKQIKNSPNGKRIDMETAISEAVDIYGKMPFAVVDGRKWFQMAKQNIIDRKSDGADLVKDIH